MNLPSLPPALLPILRCLDSLTGRAPLSELHGLLRNSPLTLRDVESLVRFDASRVCGNLIARGRWHEVLLIGWRPGQSSPIHNYAGSSCAFKVLAGVCNENVYGFTAFGDIYPIENQAHEHGAVVAAQDSDIHQISNLQPVGQNLVTLHIYSPPLKSERSFFIL